jgi:hypothetical protein
MRTSDRRHAVIVVALVAMTSRRCESRAQLAPILRAGQRAPGPRVGYPPMVVTVERAGPTAVKFRWANAFVTSDPVRGLRRQVGKCPGSALGRSNAAGAAWNATAAVNACRTARIRLRGDPGR